jgi:hypothetical protein
LKLNKEWLIDYEAHEREEFQKFLKEFDKSKKMEYPTKSRFKKLSYPIAEAASEIWSVIPFYGSSFVHVYPSRQETNLSLCGWGTDSDIDNLIQLAKDTGKVQFVLDKSPLEFQNYDYLEPILKELKPPVIELIPELVFDKDQYLKAEVEFTTLSKHKFLPFLQELYDYHDRTLDPIPSSFESFCNKYILNYATLKLSGYKEIADQILNSLIDDPNLALHYLHLYGVLLASNKQVSLNSSYNPIFSMGADPMRFIFEQISKLSGSNQNLEFQNLFIADVGESLINKLTLGTDGYLGCQSLIDKYKQQDLQKLLNSIQHGLENKNVDIVKSNTDELSVLLENLWNDNKISNLSTGISYGLPMLLGTIGPLSGDLIGGIGGILTGLGLGAFSRKITPIISDKMAKIFRNDSLIAIYDFKKKYNIKE